MRLRAASVLELVLVLGAGVAMVVWVARGPKGQAFLISEPGRQFQVCAEPFLAGIALAGGLGLGSEAARRRPETWGLGRWFWAVAALTVVFHVVATELSWLLIARRSGWRRPLWQLISGYMRDAVLTPFY